MAQQMHALWVNVSKHRQLAILHGEPLSPARIITGDEKCLRYEVHVSRDLASVNIPPKERSHNKYVFCMVG